MSRATLKAVVASDVAAAATFAVSYTTGLVQADFVAGQTVKVRVHTREFDCAVSFGASSATVTWPGGAPYSLPAGTYYIDFDLVGADEVDRFTPADNVADSTAVDVAGIVADHNALLAALKAAGVMVPD